MIETEKVTTEAVLAARKKRESGKRGFLQGRNSVACIEVLDFLVAHEKRVAETKSKKGRKKGTEMTELVQNRKIDEVHPEDEPKPMVDDD